MLLNGQILKLSFMTIIGSLCLVTIMATGFFLAGKLPIENYKSLLELLGIPTLIGMIVQSFIHSNIQTKEGDEDVKKNIVAAVAVDPVNKSS